MKRTGTAKALILAGLMVTGSLALLPPESGAAAWVKDDMGKPYTGNANSGLYGVAVGDGDRDDKTEVYFTTGDNNHIYQFTYDADTDSWDYADMTTAGNYYTDGVVVGDGDDDSKTEVYVCGISWGFPRTTNSLYQVYRNDSGWQRVSMGQIGNRGVEMAIGDGNNDSSDEVFMSDINGHIYMAYYSGGSWNIQDVGNSTSSGGGAAAMNGLAVGDGDNDGYPEVYGSSNQGALYKFYYSGSWKRTDVGTADANSNLAGIAIGDVDQDDKYELYGASASSANIYQFKWNSGTSSWDRTKLLSLGSGITPNAVEMGDGNSDGNDEFYIAASNREIYEVSYDKSTSTWSSGSVGSGNGAMNDVAVGNGANIAGQKEVYGASADGHGYEFTFDRTPPNNPLISSDTHPQTATWYSKNVVHVIWKDVGKDLSGMDGYSFSWDTTSTTVPDETKEVEENVHEANSTALSDSDSWYFHIRARDKSANWNKTAEHYGPIYMDTTAPDTVKVTINDAAEYSNNRLVTLSISASDPYPGSGVAWMSFSNDGSAWSNWEKFSASRANWDLNDQNWGGSDSDGTKTVHARVKDGVDHEIAAASRATDSIFLDRAQPSELTVLVDADAQYAVSSDVTLTLGAKDPEPASGIVRMAFSNDGISYSEWTEWKSSASWSLTAGAGGSSADGTKTVYYKAQDRAGNVGGPAKDSIFLDRKAPEGLSITINGGAEYTSDASASLSISASDPDPGSLVADMTLANAFESLGTWETYAGSKTGWSLIAGTGGTDADGDKVVHLKVRDKAGNVGGPARDSIFLDRAAPSGLGVSINDGAAYTTKLDVTLTLKAEDPAPGSGVYAMSFSDDGVRWTEWESFAASKSYSLPSGDGTKTVHFRSRDRAGNVAGAASDTIILDTHAPVIANVRASSITDTSAIISWTTDEDGDGGVDYGTTTTYGSSASDPAFSTSHSLGLKGLKAETTYHFQVYSRDRAGNPPAYAGDFVFITLATPDTTPPSISYVQVTGITDNLAVVTWTTNEPADSTVQYGTSTAYGLKSGDTNFVLKHSVTLRDLSALTTYHLKVESKDASGNGPASSEDLSFTTLAAPDRAAPVISNVRATGLTDRLAVITWETDEPADSLVEFGNSTVYGLTASDGRLVQLHEVTLSGLKPFASYHFRVQSKDATGNGPSVSEDYTFFTLAVPDRTSPAIVYVKAEGVTETTATIIWETDEISDSLVEYGLTVSYGLTAADNAYTVTHGLFLQDLSPDKTYHFRVRSADPSGNLGTSGDYTFRTLKNPTAPDKVPPVISGLMTGSVSKDQAVIIWYTDELANGEVEYGTSTAYGLRASEPTPGLFHGIVLKDLLPNTTYHARAKSWDVFGNGPALSEDLTFRTTAEADSTPPQIRNPRVVNITNGSATVLWDTDEVSTSLIDYGLDSYYGRNLSSQSLVLAHVITLTGLKADSTYYLKVYSSDLFGNLAQSTELNFTTLKIGPGPGPGPGPKPVKAAAPFPWAWLALALVLVVAAVAGAYTYIRYRQRRPPGVATPRAAGPAGGEEDVLEMEDDEAGSSFRESRPGAFGAPAPAGAGGRGPEAPAPAPRAAPPSPGDVAWGAPPPASPEGPEIEVVETVEMESDQPAPAAAGAAVLAPTLEMPASEPTTPIKHIRCPSCKSRIPLFHEGPQEVTCPTCGRRGPYKPKGAAGQSPPRAGPAPSPSEPPAWRPPEGPAPAPSSRWQPQGEPAPEETPFRMTRCSGCGSPVPIHSTDYPVRITCPVCGKSGMYKGPKA